MESDTFTATQYNTSDPTSFAHTSARERWPIIITQGIDDVHKSTSASSDDKTVKEVLRKRKIRLEESPGL